ncbi:MAG: HD domain-containing protein [Desulfitobacterium sp.]|nr:HD domain-containing protein [Desulfitobacterium sp.]
MNLMPRVNKILQHPAYEEYTKNNLKAEEKRIYCRHGEDHGLAVARVAYIYILENLLKNISLDRNEEEVFEDAFGVALNKELIYGAGILHDIGRWVEYETGEDHAQAGVRLAGPILQDCGFNEAEQKIILEGIQEHRLEPSQITSILGKALALADDWARDCKNCSSKETCYKYNKSMEDIII